MTEEEKEETRRSIRMTLLEYWFKEASPEQKKGFQLMMKDYKTFGQVREAIASGQYDWMFLAPKAP